MKKFFTKKYIFCVIILFFVLLSAIILPESYNKWMINIVSYENIRDYYKYDHVVYNGTAYYYLKSDINVPEEYIPFSTQKISVILVDEDGNPYDKNRTEEAWTYIGDEKLLFIYFQSAPFTRDKSLASEMYNFDN